MNKYNFFKNEIILILFSLSIFFSFVSISFLEFRFLYLFTIFFLIYENFYSKKITIINLFITILIVTALFCYSYFFRFINFNDLQFLDFINDEYKKNNILHLFIEIFIIGLSIIIIFFYKCFLIENLIKIIDYFVVLFVLLILFYNYSNSGILFDLLYKCDLGFFYYTKHPFKETSHFQIIAVPIILSFIFNINIYKKKKIIFIFYILFLIFTFGNFNLTFYLSLMSGIFIIFLTNNNISVASKYIFLILLIVSNMFFFRESILPNDKSLDVIIEEKFLNTDSCASKASLKIQKNISGHDYFQGFTINGPKKLNSFFSKDIKNLSIGVYVYSIYVAKKSIVQNPFGVGYKNYIYYRNVLDNSLEVDWKKTKYETEDGLQPAGKIKFKEKYIPSLPAVILNLNLHSGSNNFSKLIVEFGLLGLLTLLAIFIFCFSNRVDQQVKITLIPLIFIQLFIRGTGFYNSGFLISLIIILLIIIRPIPKKNKYENKNVK